MDNEAAALARKRWAKAKRTRKTCPFCGQDYRGVKEQVYCTPAHQQAAAAARLRAKRKAIPLPAPGAAESELALGLALGRALAEAERCRATDDLAGAERWEQMAARIAAAVAAE